MPFNIEAIRDDFSKNTKEMLSMCEGYLEHMETNGKAPEQVTIPMANFQEIKTRANKFCVLNNIRRDGVLMYGGVILKSAKK